MAHKEQQEFFLKMKNRYPHYFFNVSVIEMGSLNLNGSLREFFENPVKYVGVDIHEGPGVDLVCPAQNVTFDDNSFDVAVSAECFEHNPYWLETFANMHRIASKVVFFTCASHGRAEHGTKDNDPESSPYSIDWNYYKNLTYKDFIDCFDLESMFESHRFFYNPNSCDLYFWGIK
jgi:SAM-dependent methyltransferase